MSEVRQLELVRLAKSSNSATGVVQQTLYTLVDLSCQNNSTVYPFIVVEFHLRKSSGERFATAITEAR